MARQDALLAQAHAALLQLRPEGKGRGAWAAKRPAAHGDAEAGGVTASSNAAVGKPHAIAVKCEGEAVAAEGARAGSPLREAPGRQAAVAADIKEGAWGRSPGSGERRDLREAGSPGDATAEAGGKVQSPGSGELRRDLREAVSPGDATAEAGGKVQSPGSAEQQRDLREALRAAREELRASRVRVAVLEAEAVLSQAGAGVHVTTRAAGMLRSSGGGGTTAGKRQHSKDDTDNDASLQRDQQHQGEADAVACGGGGGHNEEDVLQTMRDKLASAEAELDELRQQLRLQGTAAAAAQQDGSAGDDDSASAGAAAGGGGGSGGGGIVRGWGGPGVSVVWVFQQLVKHVEELGNYQLPLAR